MKLNLNNKKAVIIILIVGVSILSIGLAAFQVH